MLVADEQSRRLGFLAESVFIINLWP